MADLCITKWFRMDNLQNNLQHFLNSLSTVNFLDDFHSSLERFLSLLTTGNITELSATAVTSFALIAAAEIGDKSQLVCMTLASRHRAMPVLLGAIAAFAFLNTLAVVFGCRHCQLVARLCRSGNGCFSVCRFWDSFLTNARG